VHVCLSPFLIVAKLSVLLFNAGQFVMQLNYDVMMHRQLIALELMIISVVSVL